MGLSLYREVGDRVLISTALSNLGRAALYQRKDEQAQKLFEEALELGRAANDRWTIAYALSGLGRLAGRQGDVEKGRALLVESLALFEHVRDRRSVGRSLLALARIESRAGQGARAARMVGAASAINESLGIIHTPPYVPEREAILSGARSQLGEEAFQAAINAGQGMSIEQIVKFASENVVIVQ